MINDILQWESDLKSGKIRHSLPLMSHAGIDLINTRITDAVTDGNIQFEALKAIDTVYSPDAICSFMDLTVEAEAFGCRINFYENDIPTVAAGIVNDELTVNNLAVPEPSEQRTKEYIKAVRLSTAYFISKPVFAVCIGPFSLAGRLFGMTEIMTSLLFEPEIIIALLEKCSAFLNKYIQAFKRAGANGIIMAEPAAGLLSSDQCDTFSSGFIRKIVKDVQDDKFLFILHNCGNTGHVTGSMVSTGARALHFGNRIDIAKVLDEVPADILVMGNIDPAGLFRMGDPGSMTSACNDLLCRNADHRNFVISSGCEIPPGVSDANFRAFFDAVKTYCY